MSTGFASTLYRLNQSGVEFRRLRKINVDGSVLERRLDICRKILALVTRFDKGMTLLELVIWDT